MCSSDLLADIDGDRGRRAGFLAKPRGAGEYDLHDIGRQAFDEFFGVGGGEESEEGKEGKDEKMRDMATGRALPLLAGLPGETMGALGRGSFAFPPFPGSDRAGCDETGIVDAVFSCNCLIVFIRSAGTPLPGMGRTPPCSSPAREGTPCLRRGVRLHARVHARQT